MLSAIRGRTLPTGLPHPGVQALDTHRFGCDVILRISQIQKGRMDGGSPAWPYSSQ